MQFAHKSSIISDEAEAKNGILRSKNSGIPCSYFPCNHQDFVAFLGSGIPNQALIVANVILGGVVARYTATPCQEDAEYGPHI